MKSCEINIITKPTYFITKILQENLYVRNHIKLIMYQKTCQKYDPIGNAQNRTYCKLYLGSTEFFS